MSNQEQHFVCSADCGSHVAADEDGCCAMCGADCTVVGCDCMAKLQRELAAARAVVEAVRLQVELWDDPGMEWNAAEYAQGEIETKMRNTLAALAALTMKAGT